MRLTTLLLIAGSGMALSAASAQAQGRPLPVQKPPARAQTGSAGPVTPPPAERGRVPRMDRGGQYYERGRARVTYVPVMVARDGRIYANFGYGYERVLRQCSYPQVIAQTGVRQVVPQQPTPPAYTQPSVTQPVPRAQTSSQAMVAQQQGNAGAAGNSMRTDSPSQAASGACWSRMPTGNITVQR